MSMMRASGAMLTITALQMATASLAAPKSVMKTIVGCGAVAAALPFDVPPNLPHEAFVSAIVARAAASKKRRRGMGRVPRKKSGIMLNEFSIREAAGNAKERPELEGANGASSPGGRICQRRLFGG